jgi:hypothetical protein
MMKTKKMTTSREWAVDLAEAWGWYVFPIPPNSKRAWEGWPEASTNDAEYLETSWPDDDANIGLHCGPSNLLVLDIDVVGTYEQAMDALGTSAVPDTFTVQTASGKWHMYFSVPADNKYTNRVKIDGGPVDVRVNNGYVLAPGSRIDGHDYAIEYFDPPAELASSPRLVKWVTPKPRKQIKMKLGNNTRWGKQQKSNEHIKDGILRIVLDAPDGELNSRLYWAACRAGEMIAIGEWTIEAAELALTTAATTANLESYRIGPTVQSGLRRGMDEQG